MTHRKTETLVPYTARQMYDLVADVERYPEFLPWCPALRIVEDGVENGSGEMVAEMVVAYKVFREKFRSRLTFNRAEHHINIDRLSGPFRILATDWRFEDKPITGSIVHFEINFELKSIFLQTAARAFFETKFTRMSEAFIDRADDIYGGDQA